MIKNNTPNKSSQIKPKTGSITIVHFKYTQILNYQQQRKIVHICGLCKKYEKHVTYINFFFFIYFGNFTLFG